MIYLIWFLLVTNLLQVIGRAVYLSRANYPRPRDPVTGSTDVICLLLELAMAAWMAWLIWRPA